MLRLIVSIVIFIHGLIHLLGFAKAFGYANITQLSKEISKPSGLIWLLAFILFITAAIQFFLKKDYWWISSVIAIAISHYLIFLSWHDAKFGTIANVIILLVTIIGYGTSSFSNKYKNEVKNYLDKTSLSNDLLQVEDIQTLPEPIKKYLHYTGAIGRPKVKNFKIEFTGQIRKDEKSEWMPFTSEQYNFVDASTRLFFLKATLKHLPVVGFHCFKNGQAFMDIRLFSLFKVQYQSGKEMNVAETVTFFNDMCCMAPATLIDQRIRWLETGSNKVKAEFTNNNITITAWLYFNDKGELINFISDDRFAVAENNTMKQIPWSTPMKDYQEINGNKLAGYADAIYRYPNGDLCYGKFKLTNVEYNIK